MYLDKMLFFLENIFKPSSSLETFAYLLIPLGTAFQGTYPTCTENLCSPSWWWGCLVEVIMGK